MTKMAIRDVTLNVDVIGKGYPLVLMHGGPSADLWTLQQFRRLADRMTLVFYDHRGNGRSGGAVESMTWENLTADAEALRQRLGFERWAVLGHSFGGHVALEYALRYPDSVSHLVLLNTGADSTGPRERAPGILARRGFSPATARLVRRFFNGQVPPKDVRTALLRMGTAYHHRRGLSLAWLMLRDLIAGEWRSQLRGEALTFASRELMKGWTVMDRLGEIRVPTLVMAGRDDFLFPPEDQALLAAAIPNARLHIVERAGHNPHSEQPDEVMQAVTDFLPADVPVPAPAVRKRAERRPAELRRGSRPA